MRNLIALVCLIFLTDAFLAYQLEIGPRAQGTAESSKKKNKKGQLCRDFRFTAGDKESTTSENGTLKFNYVVAGTRKCDWGRGYYVRCRGSYWKYDGSDENCNSSGNNESAGASDATTNSGRQNTEDNLPVEAQQDDPGVYCYCLAIYRPTNLYHSSRVFKARDRNTCYNSSSRFGRVLKGKNERVTIRAICSVFPDQQSASEHREQLLNHKRKTSRIHSGIFADEIDLGEKKSATRSAELAKYPCVYKSKIYKKHGIVRGPINFDLLLHYGQAVYKNKQTQSIGCECKPNDRSIKGWYCH